MSNNTAIGVNELIKNIKSGLTQKSASTKDETSVMKAMLNDTSFNVDVYSNSGVETHCPAKDFRAMISGVVSSTAKINKDEAAELVNNYEFKTSDASTMVQVSKDFFNTALQTGRKINFGGTATSNISIQAKDIKESIKRYPKKVGDNADGSARYENVETRVPAHGGLTVKCSCPNWVTDKK